MGKHSKKRRRDSSSSDNEEYYLRKKLLRLQSRLSKLDKEQSLASDYSVNREVRSLSPIAGSSKMQDHHDESLDGDQLDEDISMHDKDSTIQEKENVPPALPGLDNNVLAILGFNFEPDIKAAPPIQTEIAVAWTNILVNGLKEEERSILVKKYKPPDNCNLLEVPKLNPEVTSVIKSFVASRDTKMGELQNQIGTSLAALGQLLSDLLKVNDGNTQHIQLLSDACRLLLDFHHKQSMSRRELVMYDLKNDVKDLLSSSKLDGWLFGEKLGDRLRVSKEVERTGLELKPLRSKVIKRNILPQQPSKTLNYPRPLRRQGEYQSGRKVAVQNPRSSNNRRYKPQLSHQERKVRRGGVFHQKKENRERM